MGLNASKIEERVGGFPWHAIQTSTEMHAMSRSDLVVAQVVTMHGMARAAKLLAYRCTLHGSARSVDAIVFEKVTLHGAVRIGTLHCLASTRVVQHGMASIGKRLNHTRQELVAMAREHAALGPEVQPNAPMAVAHAVPVHAEQPYAAAAAAAVPVAAVAPSAHEDVKAKVYAMGGSATTRAAPNVAPVPSAPPLPAAMAVATAVSAAAPIVVAGVLVESPQQQQQQQQQQQVEGSDVASQLTQLHALKVSGALSEAEFNAAKANVLSM